MAVLASCVVKAELFKQSFGLGFFSRPSCDEPRALSAETALRVTSEDFPLIRWQQRWMVAITLTGDS